MRSGVATVLVGAETQTRPAGWQMCVVGEGVDGMDEGWAGQGSRPQGDRRSVNVMPPSPTAGRDDETCGGRDSQYFKARSGKGKRGREVT